jgi:FkbM family methyltransferase
MSEAVPRRRPLPRRLLRAVWHGLRAGSSGLATALLRRRATREVLNRAHLGLGARFQNGFDALFEGAKIPRPFEWRCRFGDREYVMPVWPELQRSWNAALAWGWRGNRSIRQLYENYLRRTAPGTLLDVGANDGTHSYPFAVHGFECVCFEPQASCVDYIDAVCRANGFARVTAVKSLVGDEETGDAVFFVSPSSWFSSRMREHTERFEPAAAMSAPSLSLDAYCRTRELRPTLIKIDVEGWEWPVLHGAHQVIAAHRPDLFVEVLAANPDKRRIWDLARVLDYACILVSHYTTRPFTRIGSLETFLETPGAYSNDYFFTPRTDLVSGLGCR